MSGLPWAPLLGRRCRARISVDESPHRHGRCELARHGLDVDHALEWGMETLRWDWVMPRRELTPLAELIVGQAIERRRGDQS